MIDYTAVPKKGKRGLSEFLRVRRFFRYASTMRSLNIMANCVFASNHSRGGRFHPQPHDSTPNIPAWLRRRQMANGLRF